MASVQSNSHRTFPTQHSHLFQMHHSPREGTFDMGQLAACLGKKVNMIMIFLILFDHMLFPLSLVSFRSWTQQQGKPFIFNQIDLTVKRRKTETEHVAGSGKSRWWDGRRRKEGKLHRHRCQLSPPSHSPLNPQSTQPGSTLYHPSLTFTSNRLQVTLWGNTCWFTLPVQV